MQNIQTAANFTAATRAPSTLHPQGASAFNKAAEGAVLQFAAGVMGQAFNKLVSGPFAFPALPTTARITAGLLGNADSNGVRTVAETKTTWTAALTDRNKAAIDLGDGYKLNVDERNSELTVVNEKTGEKTRIWGDPHVDVDGKHAFDFWGTTTFKLENGTKITINTEQYKNNPNMYVASQVVITKGEQAIVVDGISQNQLGDLKVTQSNDGYAIDSAHRDGFVLDENATGKGWRSEFTGEVATQKDLDATRIGREYGPGSQALSLGEAEGALALFSLAGAMGQWLNFGSLISFATDLGHAVRDTSERTRPINVLPFPASVLF